MVNLKSNKIVKKKPKGKGFGLASDFVRVGTGVILGLVVLKKIGSSLKK